MTWLVLLLGLTAHARTVDCGDPETLTTSAMLGILADAEVSCLHTRLDSEDRARGEYTWRLLLVDSLAKGRHRQWRRLVDERSSWRASPTAALAAPRTSSVTDLDCADVDVYLANIRACHVRAKAREYAIALEATGGSPLGSGPVDLAACADVGAVHRAAELGRLTDAQRTCLLHHLAATSDEDVEAAIVMMLLEDAMTRGGDEAVDALMSQILTSLDCTDPDVYLEHESSCDVLHQRVVPEGEADRRR